MVQITILKNKQGAYTGFTFKGHAGYAESGSDIVCAAVSVLVINTLNSIETFTKDVPEVHMDEKKGLIDCRFSNEICKETVLLLDSMILGLQSVEEEYGKKYIRLTY